MPDPVTTIGVLGWLFAAARELLIRRRRASLGRAVDTGARAARFVASFAKAIHIDTAQLLARARQEVTIAGLGFGFTDAQMAAAYDAARDELGRLLLAEASGRLERELAELAPVLAKAKQ